MRDFVTLFVHLVVTVARLAGPGGIRSVAAESVLVKHQLLILNRSRKRAPNLRAADRIIAGCCALLMRPARVLRSAIVLKPSTLLNFHHAPKKRTYQRLSKFPSGPIDVSSQDPWRKRKHRCRVRAALKHSLQCSSRFAPPARSSFSRGSGKL